MHALQVFVRTPVNRTNTRLFGQDMWSSSQGTYASFAWHETFRGSGYMTDNAYKDQQAFVRPIRAFVDPLANAGLQEESGDAPDEGQQEPESESEESDPPLASLPTAIPTRVPGASKKPAIPCSRGGACVVGDRGPGGGIVFHDAGPDQEWGRYLEAAPVGWSGSSTDPTAAWCPQGRPGFNGMGGPDGIGQGPANTRWILDIGQCGVGSAAGRAVSYRGGGLADWFLPSKDELDELYVQRGKVGGFGSDEYWSSTQDEQSAPLARFQIFGSGDQWSDQNKTFEFRVRPIRAF